MLRLTILCLLSLAICATPTMAKPKHSYQHKAAIDKVELAGYQFSPAEKHMIRADLIPKRGQSASHPHNDLPPGLKKKLARGKQLPPGWQKKLAAGDRLDYQAYRQGQSLPDELLQRLPMPPGAEVLQVEETILLLDAATRVVLDLFELNPTP
jgi:hypothetical protein